MNRMARITSALALLAACQRGGALPLAATADGMPPSESRRTQIEVLNPGKISGLARSATVALRKSPQLDVVFFGSARDSTIVEQDRTVIYVRRGDTTGVGLVKSALGAADVIDRADPARFVDLTVIPGRQFGTRGKTTP